MDSTKGILRLEVSRGGTADEAISFLSDIQDSYENLYVLNYKIDEAKKKYEEKYGKIGSLWYSKGRPPALAPARNVRELVLPDERLSITKVSIGSPGFWEVLGSLNPLQQLREYLKDRHERLKDKGGRQQEELRGVSLENDKKTIEIRRMELENIKLENEIVRGQVETLRQMGYADEQIRRLLNRHYFEPLSKLDGHQNSGLLETAVIEPEKKEGQ